MAKPPLTVTLSWDHALEFTGESGKHEVGMDGASYSAPSPMAMLALALAGCMAIDLVHILTRGRHTVTSLKTTFHGERAAEDPKRFTRIRLDFELTGRMEPEHVERAIDLSRQKYCSVWGTFRQEIELITSFTITKSN